MTKVLVRFSAMHSRGGVELLDASFRGNVGKVEEALGRGANVNCQHFMGTRPLHRAAMNGHVEVVQFLLAAGADPNARVTEDGNTPMHTAADFGYKKVAQILFAAGADLNATNTDVRIT